MINLFKEYSIGVKKLSDAELGRKSSESSQTHIGLSDKVLTFLPNEPEQRLGILVYNKSCSLVECAFSKILNKRSTKVDSITTNPVKSVVKQIRNIAEDENFNWYIIWFALDNQMPVICLFNNNSDEFSEISKFIDLNRTTSVYTSNTDEFYKIIDYIQQSTKLDSYVNDKYFDPSKNILIAYSTGNRTFVHLVLDFFRRSVGLEKMLPFFSTTEDGLPIKVYCEGNFKLSNMFMFSDFAEIKKRNETRIRWFTDPFFINNRSLYLYVDWYTGKNKDGKDVQLMIPDFIQLIHKCYGLKYVYRNSQGTHELWIVNSPDAMESISQTEDSHVEESEKTEIDIAQIPFSIKRMIQYINETGLIYTPELVKRFAFSLMTKPFVILSGLAGSGKTQLALAFASALVEDKEKQLCMLSVGADWTNREPMLGFPNALNKDQYIRPESGVLDLLIEANNNPEKPYFLILDEMNMSYVERYFADFLSSMESHEAIKLWNGCGFLDGEEEYDDTPKTINLSKNLFIIGTINVDETTYMFSPKVLDRANVIEFKIAETEMESFLKEMKEVDCNIINGQAKEMGKSFVELASNKGLPKNEDSEKTIEILNDFFKVLKKVNAEFGYRSATEIFRFINQAQANDDTDKKMNSKQILDAAIVQKLLPKLHGSRKKLEPVLLQLWKMCLKKEDKDTMPITRENVANAEFKESADKIQRMYDSAYANGFTSFAEA